MLTQRSRTKCARQNSNVEIRQLSTYSGMRTVQSENQTLRRLTVAVWALSLARETWVNYLSGRQLAGKVVT